MTSRIRTYQFGDVTVSVGDSWCVTHFADGTEVHAHANHRDEDKARAAELGYPNVEQMTRHHDLMHSMIANARGWSHSKVLWALAHNEPSPDCADEEERLAMFAQRLVASGLESILDQYEVTSDEIGDAVDALDVIGGTRGTLTERINMLFARIKELEAARD